jgi:iron(III) transport system substrate-binding protein
VFRPIRLSWIACCAALTAASVLTGCGSSANTITLYNGQHPQTTTALVRAFTKATGIHVTVRSDDENVLADQIAAEAHSPADVIYTENSQPLQFLQEKELLDRLPARILDHVPSRFNSTAQDWVGVSARVSVLVYNTSKLQPSQLPRSVLDLAEPRWRGLVGIAPGETDFQPIITSIVRARGQTAALDWLKALKTNAGQNSYPDNESLVTAVNSGQVAIGIINHYYWYRLRQTAGSIHSAIAFFKPADPGYVMDVSGAAVLKSTHRKAAAQKFLAFLVGRRGEEIIAHSDSFEYPLGSAVKPSKAIPPFDSLQPNPITLDQLGDGKLAVHLLQQAELL